MAATLFVDNLPGQLMQSELELFFAPFHPLRGLIGHSPFRPVSAFWICDVSYGARGGRSRQVTEWRSVEWLLYSTVQTNYCGRGS